MRDKPLQELARDIAISDLVSINQSQQREIWHLRAAIVELEANMKRLIGKIQHYESIVRMN